MTQILINTYNRPVELLALLNQLDDQDEILKVAINDDGSNERLIFPPYKHLIVSVGYQLGNHGKELYWKTCTNLFKMVDKSCDEFIMLPDDAILVDGFLEKARKYWHGINDMSIACNILLLKNFKTPNWTGKTPKKWNINGSNYWTTGWIDGCFICGIDLFEELKYYIDSISLKRWTKNPLYGSGVGQNMTLRLNKKGLFHSEKSLVYFDDPTASKMNPEARKKTPTIAVV